MSKKPASSLASLISAGKTIEQEVVNRSAEEQEIVKEADLEVITHKKVEEIKKIEKNEKDIVTDSSTTINSYSLNEIFKKRFETDKNKELVRIPTYLHDKIRLVASLSKVPITDAISNIIETYLKENSKEIDRYIRKQTSNL